MTSDVPDHNGFGVKLMDVQFTDLKYGAVVQRPIQIPRYQEVGTGRNEARCAVFRYGERSAITGCDKYIVEEGTRTDTSFEPGMGYLQRVGGRMCFANNTPSGWSAPRSASCT